MAKKPLLPILQIRESVTYDRSMALAEDQKRVHWAACVLVGDDNFVIGAIIGRIGEITGRIDGITGRIGETIGRFGEIIGLIGDHWHFYGFTIHFVHFLFGQTCVWVLRDISIGLRRTSD